MGTPAQVEAFLRDTVAVRAAEIDADPEALGEVLDAFFARGFGALRVSEAYGGPAWSPPDLAWFQRESARASGTFAFLQTQHQSAAAMLETSAPEAMRRAVLPGMRDGRRRIGIGFSQLRRPGPPVLRARAEGDGFRLDGHVPWVTGYGFFGEFLLGAALPDGRSVFGLALLQNGPSRAVSTPMALAAMNAARTVTVDFENHRLEADAVAFIKPPGWIQDNDRINVAQQGHFALGCAQAGLDVLRANAEGRGETPACETLSRLESEWEQVHADLEAWQGDVAVEAVAHRAETRAHAIDLMFRCAQAAVVSSAGAANSLHHPAQRVYREALVFSVSAQTPVIRAATLKRLSVP
jgi:alkylation response protein AidB-like acyl-CoA dehydrogenase